MHSEDLTSAWADALNTRKTENAIRLKGEESTFQVKEVIKVHNPVPTTKAPVIPEVPSANKQA